MEGKTHYVDINGETEFVESMYFKYAAAAKEKGLAIVSTCGFDCIPSEMGNVFVKREFLKLGYTPAVPYLVSFSLSN